MFHAEFKCGNENLEFWKLLKKVGKFWPVFCTQHPHAKRLSENTWYFIKNSWKFILLYKNVIFFFVNFPISQGVMQDVKIIVSNHGHLAQCPESERQCPTCGQYHDLLNTVQLMEARMRKLEQKVCITLLQLTCFFFFFCIYVREKNMFCEPGQHRFCLLVIFFFHFKTNQKQNKTKQNNVLNF